MDVKKLTTDVVVVGGGGAACRAAIEVSEKGLDTIMLDKGRPGRSGATPCALWSIQAPFGAKGRDERDTPDQFFEDMVKAGRFIWGPEYSRSCGLYRCRKGPGHGKVRGKFRKV